MVIKDYRKEWKLKKEDGICIQRPEEFPHYRCYQYIDEFDCLARGYPERRKEGYTTQWLSGMNSCDDFCERVNDSIYRGPYTPTKGMFTKSTHCEINEMAIYTHGVPQPPFDKNK